MPQHCLLLVLQMDSKIVHFKYLAGYNQDIPSVMVMTTVMVVTMGPGMVAVSRDMVMCRSAL